MNPFSSIELELLNGFALFIAGIIAFGGVIVLACITYLETRDWWQDAHAPEPAPAPPVTVKQPEPTRVTHLVLLPDPPHRPWVDDALMDWVDITDPKHDGLRCAQGMRIIHGKDGTA